MNKKTTLRFVIFIAFLCAFNANAQDFPTKEWLATAHDKPLIFYISGDGGFNKFSDNLCASLNKKGYDVFSLNAKSYFSNKKTPEQTTIAINNYIFKRLTGRPNQQVIMIGYSFGADILPFVLNRLPQSMLEKIKACFMMASSGTTDFETHWSDMFGGNTKRSMDVVTEINKLTTANLIILNGSDENDLALNKITLKKYTHEVLPGGHHFDGDTDEIIKVILNDIN